MAKKRKTRRQKELSDLRHQYSFVPTRTTPLSSENIPAETSSPIRNYTFQTASHLQPISKAVPSNEYEHVSKDLIKTTVLTGSIIIVELLLLFGLGVGR